MLNNKNIEPNTAAMERAAAELDIELGNDTAENVKTLRAFFKEVLDGEPAEKWLECAECAEYATDDVDFCPFCGDEGDEEDDESETEDDESDDGVEDPSNEITDLDDEEDPEDPEDPPTVDVSGDDDTEEPEPEAEEEAEDAPASKPAKAKGDKPVKVPAMKKKLDKLSAGIIKDTKDISGRFYDIGLKLKAVYDEDLWKADGHKTFPQYCKAISIPYGSARRMIVIVERYDRKTYQEVGPKRLDLITSAADEDKADLMRAAKDGATASELKKERDARKQRREGKEDGGGKTSPTPPKSSGAKPEAVAEGTIALLARVGGRAKSVKWKDRESRDVVDAWNDETYAEIPISEDVTMFAALKVEDDTIVGLTYSFKAIDPKPAAETVEDSKPTPAKKKKTTKKAPAKKKTTKKAPAKKKTTKKAKVTKV